MDNNQESQHQAPHQQHLGYADDEIDLRELFGILWAEKWLIVSITAIAAVLSVIYSLLQT